MGIDDDDVPWWATDVSYAPFDLENHLLGYDPRR